MAGNTFGRLLALTSFGESHGKGVGGVLDGFPAGIPIDMDFIRNQVRKRRTGIHPSGSPRIEGDEVEFLSGIRNGQSTGAPIAFWIQNTDVSHTAHQEGVLRPSHASYTYWKKYGFYDYDGGGRASARETVVRVVGGALAALLLHREGVGVFAFTRQIGPVALDVPTSAIEPDAVSASRMLCPDPAVTDTMEEYLLRMRKEGDTTGAMVSCKASGLPTGLGDPVFAKLSSDLAAAMMGINAAKAFEYGSGMNSASKRGSELNDLYTKDFHTITNHSGGIQGGISNGEPLCFNVAFKPVPGIMRDQPSINEQGEEALLESFGRHDVCVAPRVVPVVEAMASLVLADHLLMNNAYQFYRYSEK